MLFGDQWTQRVIIVGAIVLYTYLGITSPETARKGIIGSWKTFANLFTLIFAALMIANAIGLLLPAKTVMKWFGEEAGLKGVIRGGILGGLLQGGPYAAYPIIKSLYDKGAHISIVISMLIGYGAIGLSRLAYELIFFNFQILSIRLLITVPLTIIAGIILYLLI